MLTLRSAAVLLLAATLPLVAADPGPGESQWDVKRAPWPQVHGPYGNGSAPEQGLKLVDDITRAKLAWKSDLPVPSSSPLVGKKPAPGGLWGGEYCSPIAADGKVYVAYWRLTGRKDWTVLAEDVAHWVKSGRNPTKDRPDTADDILLCVDAKTGRTVWEKTVGTGKPIDGYKSGAHMACAWWDGKVVFVGVNQALYCLDGTSGEVLWQTKNKGDGGGRSAPTPLVSGGVVHCGGTGYDVASGKQLWSLPGGHHSANDFGTPWQHGGVPYFIFNTGLVEARTGRVCWTIPEGASGTGPSVWGDLMVMADLGGNAQKRETKPENWPHMGMPVFRISPEKCEKLWQAEGPPMHGQQYLRAIIHRGRAIGGQQHAPGTPGTLVRHDIAVDLTTGTFEPQIKEGRLPLGYTPCAAEGRVFHAGGTSMEMGVLDREDFGKMSRLPNAAETCGAAYADGFLFFRQRLDPKDQFRLVCYDLRAR